MKMGGLFKLKLKKVKCEGVQLIYLVPNGIQLSDLVNTIINHWVPYKKGVL